MSGPPKDYVEVNERLIEWRDKYPDGTLQAEVVPCPVDGFVIVKAYAYRTPDDPRPGTGLAWEPVPGQTNFTRDSELMNCETSAWGRALIAVGAADAKRGIASANEVRNRSNAPGPVNDKPPPGKRIEAALAKAKVPAEAFVAYLGSEGFERFSEVPPQTREAMADGIVDGVLLDDVRLFVEPEEVPS